MTCPCLPNSFRKMTVVGTEADLVEGGQVMRAIQKSSVHGLW